VTDPPSGPLLVVLYLAWLVAAATIAIIVAVLVGELAASVGLVARDGPGSQVLFDVVALVGFLVMAALPFLLRHRTRRDGDDG